MPPSLNQRNEYADLLKGLLMFAVLTLHTGGTLAPLPASRGEVGTIWLSMGPWSMPLFMAVSGYFFFFSAQKRGPKELLYNKIICLLVPTVIWIYVGKLTIVAMNLHKPFVMPSLWPWGYWFIWSALGCMLLTTIIHYVGSVSNRKTEFFLAGSVGVLLHFLPEKNFHFAYMFVFFYGGYLCNRFSWHHLFRTVHYIAFLLLSIGCWIFSVYSGYASDWSQWVTGSYIFGPRGWAVHLFYVVFRDVMGILGSVGFAGIVDVLWRGKLQRLRKSGLLSAILGFFLTLGRYSLAVYLIQGLFIEGIFFRIAASLEYHFGNVLTASPFLFKWILAPSCAVLMGLLCLWIMKIILRHKLLKRFLLGNLG